MNVPTSPAGAEKSHPVELDVEALNQQIGRAKDSEYDPSGR